MRFINKLMLDQKGVVCVLSVFINFNEMNILI